MNVPNEGMPSVLKLTRQRQWAKVFVSIILLAGCCMASKCFDLFAKEDPVYEMLEKRVRSGKKFRGPEFETLTARDQERLKNLYRRTYKPIHMRQRPSSPLRVFSPSPSSSPSSSPPTSKSLSRSQSLIEITLLFLMGLVLYRLIPQPRKPQLPASLLHRLAMFNCPECERPASILGAQQALITRVARPSPQFKELDESQLTPRQRSGPEIVWVEMRCVHCDKNHCFDEVGVAATPPPKWEEQEKNLIACDAPQDRSVQSI